MCRTSVVHFELTASMIFWNVHSVHKSPITAKCLSVLIEFMITTLGQLFWKFPIIYSCIYLFIFFLHLSSLLQGSYGSWKVRIFDLWTGKKGNLKMSEKKNMMSRIFKFNWSWKVRSFRFEISVWTLF